MSSIHSNILRAGNRMAKIFTRASDCFRCKENDCKAAFTTKQCLQFHYKKVHGLTEEMMPKIERSVAYTFDAYSGGIVEEAEEEEEEEEEEEGEEDHEENRDSGSGESSAKRGSQVICLDKWPRFARVRQCVCLFQQQESDDGILSLDECSTENNGSRADASMNSLNASLNELESVVVVSHQPEEQEEDQRSRHLPADREDLGECESSDPPLPPRSQIHSHHICLPPAEIDMYAPGTRLQSKGSKKWMGLFNPPATDIYEFEEPVKKDQQLRNEMAVASALNIYRRPESTNASLLVEAALDAAERDIGGVSSPILDDGDRHANSLYTISNLEQSPATVRSNDSHLDSYMQQQQLMSPGGINQDRPKTPCSHVHMDYHLHRPIDYINSPGRSHSMEQYLPQDDLNRASSSPTAGYINLTHEGELGSPEVTPNANRYEDYQQQQHHHHHHHHHHRVPTDNVSSDEGDSVAQNLSLGVKDKSLQLTELPATYKYDTLENELCRDRGNFEPLILNTGELQGLDMSARGFHHHGLASQLPPNTRYHHHHLYEITERQTTVDLSRTSGYSMSPPPPSSPPPPPPPYPHSGEVLRIVSLDLRPRHSVDLSLSRSHHLNAPAGARVIANGSQSQVTSSSHAVVDSPEARVISSSPPSPPAPLIAGYNGTYPVSPAAYHPPRPAYHHYSGYY